MDEETVFVVDDEVANRELFAAIFDSVGIKSRSFESAQEFLANFDEQVPGCILLDIRMPGMSGLELQQKLKNDGVPHPIIIVTAHGDISIAIEAMKAGAYDFLEKPIRNQQLLEIVQRALREGRETASRQQQKLEMRGRFAELTPREKEVLSQVVEGEPNKRIAFNLDISVKTVELHRAKVMQKTGARSLAELIRLVVEAEADTADN